MTTTTLSTVQGLNSLVTGKIKSILVGFAVLCLVTGCVVPSNQEAKSGTQQTIQNKIVEGTTTKDQVRTALGEAASVSFSSDDEVWTYSYTQPSSRLQNFVPIANFFTKGSYLSPQQLIVKFDKKGIVSKYTIHSDVLHGIN
ncbi:MAG: hypothetical protein NVS3B3_15280 [Aquirhabdus sp.]